MKDIELNIQEIGERFAEERKNRIPTQEEAAQLCGVTRGAISKFERGVNLPGGEVLAKMAKKGADVQYILTGKPSANWPPDEPTPLDEELVAALLARLKAAMTADGQELPYLWRDIGVDKDRLGKMLDGKLPLSALTLLKLAAHMGIDANWLLRVQDSEIPAESVKFYNPLPITYLTDKEEKLIKAYRQAGI
jgi:transcriptional regulator with XRE-family HTH domain